MHECDQTGGGLWCRIEEEVSARVAEERVAETIETKIVHTQIGANTVRRLSTRKRTTDFTERGLETLFRVFDPNAEGRVTTEVMQKILKRCGVRHQDSPDRVEIDSYGYVSLYDLKTYLLDLDKKISVPSSYSARKTARYDLLRRKRQDAREHAIEVYRQENPPPARCAACREPLESIYEKHTCFTSSARPSKTDLVISKRTRDSKDWFQVWTSREEKRRAERARLVCAVRMASFLQSKRGRLLLEDMHMIHESRRLELDRERDWRRLHERPCVKRNLVM